MRRSKHSLSHQRLFSFNMGQLYPITLMEVLPGDSFRHSIRALIRIAPLVAPVMHHVEVVVHSWFAPSRLLWTGWESLVTGKASTPLPTVTAAPTDANFRQLAQCFGAGYSQNAPAPVTLQALPFRMYNWVWNEFYRDQDLQGKLNERRGDTGDVVGDYQLMSPCWEKDYFTTCRAAPQQGSAPLIPITWGATTAPVRGIGKTGGTANLTNQGPMHETGLAGTTTYATAMKMGDTQTVFLKTSDSLVGGTFKPDVYAQLDQAGGGISVEDWRRGYALHKIKEARNRYGSRYTDYLASLGITSSDARLQRPEYLGGGRNTVAFSEVLSTADSGSADVGSMTGHGIASISAPAYRRYFEEHGYIMTLMFMRPRTSYVNAVHRTLLRRTQTDFWMPELELQGDQSVTNFEVYGDASDPAGVFGYQQRFDEYRHQEGSVAGEFRNLLDFWHLARKFTTQPVLNGSFVKCDPSTRIYAVANTDNCYAMVQHKVATRRMVSRRAR